MVKSAGVGQGRLRSSEDSNRAKRLFWVVRSGLLFLLVAG